MLRTVPKPLPPPVDTDIGIRKREQRTSGNKRPHSCSPIGPRTRVPICSKKPAPIERRCQSMSPLRELPKSSLERLNPKSSSVSPDSDMLESHTTLPDSEEDKETVLPQCVVTKVMRNLATKKREFIKLRKSLMLQQNVLLEQYASLKELESRAGVSEDSLGDMRVLSVTSWPAHDLLMLVRDDLEMPLTSEISGPFGTQILQQLNAQLNNIPEEVLSMGAEVMARRIELLNVLRTKYRNDRSTTTIETKTKNIEFDNQTEALHRMVAGLAENLKAKINYSLELAKIPWLDREAMVKKIERLQKEILILQHKVEESTKKESDECKESEIYDSNPKYKTLSEELAKERAAREALKEVVSAAESMLRVARARIATLERQLKESRAEFEASRRKHKELEQLVNRLALEHSQKTYRHRESSFDARSRKLLEVSKTGEITIEALSRQRDALELRVKELHEQAQIAERAAEVREAEERSRIDSLQAKVAEQERQKVAAETRVAELDCRVKELEEQIQLLRESSMKLVDMERRRCVEYLPTKESEPTDRETEIWKELHFTRTALASVEEELRQSRADKDNFLNSLSRIAQGEGTEKLQDKMATELLEKEQKIIKLQLIIEEQRKNEKSMEQSMTQYENKLASLRLEVKRLRNYDCYAKEIPHQELQTELLDLHMRVETLSRERTALMTAAASRALLLERHERSADLFARLVRARRDLVAVLDGNNELPSTDEVAHTEVSRSLSSMCATGADTWSALRAERARVLRLESALLEQCLQLEREGRVRTQLERRRTILEREVMRSKHSSSTEHWVMGQNTSFVHQ